VARRFESAVRFGNAPNTTDLYRYAEILNMLIHEVTEMKRQRTALGIKNIREQMDEARKLADALLVPYDQSGKRILQPLLDAPLTPVTR
jgi:hypothetical protein